MIGEGQVLNHIMDLTRPRRLTLSLDMLLLGEKGRL